MARGKAEAAPRPWKTMPEEELLGAVLRREAGAWSGFYARYERLVVSCIRKVLHRYTAFYAEEDIEDMVNTVCLNLVKDDYHKLKSYDVTRGYKLSSWVGLIATNTAHDALRRRDPIHASLDDTGPDDEEPRGRQIADGRATPSEALDQREEWGALLRAIHALSDGDREFLSLYYEQELEPEEIAKQLKISVNTVYSRKNKVREKLKKIVIDLDEDGKSDARGA